MVYTLVDSDDVRMWKSDRLNYITSELLRRRYRIASEAEPSLLVHVPLPSLMRIYSFTSHDVDLLMGAHSIACGSTATLHDKMQLLQAHVCSIYGGCSTVVPFMRMPLRVPMGTQSLLLLTYDDNQNDFPFLASDSL